jgi:hypothetical protein
MRWLSKLIKADNVIVDKPRHLIVLALAVKRTAEACPEPQAGAESTDDSPQKKMLDYENDILSHAKFRSREIYEQSRKQGVVDGYAEGLRQYGQERERQTQEAANCAAAMIEQQRRKTDLEYSQTVEEINKETVDFAFFLASKVLNEHIDRENSGYSDLFDQSDRANVAQENETQASGAQAIVFGETSYVNDHAVVSTPEKILINVSQADLRMQVNEGRPVSLEDIIRLDGDSRRRLVDSVDIRDVVIALKGTDEITIQTVLSGFTERMQDTIREELNLSGPALYADVEKARIRIGRVLRRLQMAGDIVCDR